MTFDAMVVIGLTFDLLLKSDLSILCLPAQRSQNKEELFYKSDPFCHKLNTLKIHYNWGGMNIENYGMNFAEIWCDMVLPYS